jgi:AcrR family transcriptional regulator
MAGYGPIQMVKTPWGRADQLRERMLRPGPGMPREDVARSQRERLFGATVACIASQGYEATTVADLLELSGVSRSAFYEHFHDKEDCVLAAFDAVVARSAKLVDGEMSRNGSGDTGATNALDAVLKAIAEQEAAASLCFSDIYAAGERGRLAVERAMAWVIEVADEAIVEIRGSKLPRDLVHGLVGGAHSVIQVHIHREEVERLPEYARALRDLALSYEAPSVSLRLAGRRPRPTGGPPPFVAYSQAEKIVRALAAAARERGYPAVTVAEIAARASISQATFYSYFVDKQAALVAAIDSAETQMLGVAMPAARRAPDWPNAIRAAIGGICAFYASEPDLGRLAVVEIYGAGPTALRQRDLRFEAFLALLEPGFEAAPDTKPIVADVVLGAVWTLISHQIVNEAPEALPQIAPLATYLTLSPFLGAKEAARIANGDGRDQPSR